MATLAQPSPSPSPPLHRRSKSWARRCERYCCSCLSLFPLSFVYGLTTWAVWAQSSMGFTAVANSWTGTISAFIGIIFHILLNWCYTTAVFTNPGSPLIRQHVYSSIPTHSLSHTVTALTVKSTGEHRFCKKCNARKPDRAHHCSTCGRCVLKMDHHCPWLATCVGLRNYKPFVLFLVYTCLFCYTCFATSAKWTWGNIVGDNTFGDDERLMPVNYILLAVLSGIFAIVLTGFTGWHLWLACEGQTTIESLEKTRYLSPVHKQMQAQITHQRRKSASGREQQASFADQLREIHANALPSVTRPEEGEVTEEDGDMYQSSPPHGSLRQTYSELEAQRERNRYNAYLDEMDSDKLPNAFDLGWRRNLRHVFGKSPLLWMLPICNTTGDGWTWEASTKWVEAREDLAQEREARQREDAAFNADGRGWLDRARPVDVRGDIDKSQKLDASFPRSEVSMHTLESRGTRTDNEDDSSDEDDRHGVRARLLPNDRKSNNEQWNDLPPDMLAVPKRTPPRNRSPRPARAYPNT